MAKENNSEREGIVSRLNNEYPDGLKSVSGFAISGNGASYFLKFKKTIEGADVFDVKYTRNGDDARETEMLVPVACEDYVRSVVECFYELQEEIVRGIR